jgi:hypothetical protein
MGKSTEVPAKRHDPNYIQLSGDVRKELVHLGGNRATIYT